MWLCLWSSSDKIVELAQFLIAKGIDLRQTNNDGDNALIWLCLWSNSDKIVELAQLLIDKGVDRNQTNNERRNAYFNLKKNPFIKDKPKLKAAIAELLEISRSRYYQ